MRHFASLLFVLSACKPAEEPPRRANSAIALDVSTVQLGPPTGNVRVTERVDATPEPSTAPPIIGIVTRSHEDVQADVVHAIEEVDPSTDASAADAIDGDADTPTWPTRPEDLPPALIRELAVEYGSSAREEARRLNKEGLEAHKRLALDDAASAYLKALEAMPSFPFARYNLACARALQKRDDEALFHLAVLRHLMDQANDKTSRDRLEAARIDGDFDLLRDDVRFRALTGATAVLVTWVGGGDLKRAEALALVKSLRDAKWPAKAATTPWQSTVPANIIRVRGQDPIAEESAKAMAAVLQDASLDASAAGWPIEIGAPLPPDAPPILVILAGKSDEPSAIIEPIAPAEAPATDPDPTPPIADPGFKTLADALGRRLRARVDRGGELEHHQLELKSTGFFAWDVALAGGVRQRRAGRWSGGEGRLSLSYKQTTEAPALDPAAAPSITVEDGLTLDLRVEVGPHGVSLDGLIFK